MNAGEVKALFDPQVIDLGIVKSGDKCPFTIYNNSPYKITSHSKSCSCVGDTTSEDWKVTGELVAEFKEAKKTDLYLINGDYYQAIPQGDVIKYLSLRSKSFIDNPTDVKKVVASKYDQVITCRLDDGRDMEVVKANGEVTENTEKLKVSIPITAWVLQK